MDACGQRWVDDLANFNFTLHYKPGSTNTFVDALSRNVWPDVLTQAEIEEFESMPANLVQAICLGVVCERLIDNTAHGLSVLPLKIIFQVKGFGIKMIGYNFNIKIQT